MLITIQLMYDFLVEWGFEKRLTRVVINELGERAESAAGRDETALAVVEVLDFVVFHVVAFAVFPVFNRQRMRSCNNLTAKH